MATILPGMHGTGDWATDQRPKNFREMVLYLFPDSPAVMVGFMGKLATESTDDPEFAWWEQGLPTMRALANAEHNNTATTIVITGADAYKAFRAGHAVLVESTLEVMWVSASQAVDGSTSSLTVTRGKGSTAATIPSGDGLLIIGPHSEEGADAPTAIHRNPSKLYNYTQIFRHALYITETSRQTNLRTGDEYKKRKKDLSEEHAIAMEQAFLFGTGVETTGTGGKPMRTTKGFIAFVSSNVFDYTSSGVSSSILDDDFEQLFRQGSSTRLLICGSQLLNVFNQAFKSESSYQLKAGESVYGIKVVEYITPFGRILMKVHPLLSQNATFRSWGIILDTKNLKYRPLRGRDTMYLKDRQGNSTDAVMDELLTEAGLEVNHESTHAIIKGATALAA